MPSNLNEYLLLMKVNLRIAPGESNVPINLLFYEHAFSQICLGKFRTFRDGVTVIPFTMATNKHRRSDRRRVIPQQ